MEKVKTLTVYLYKHHLMRYLFVGGTTFVIDFGLLVLLHGKLGAWLPLATALSYTVSVTFNFCLNRWWTFNASESKSLRKHLVPYATLLSFNLLFTVAFVSIASHFINYAIAKIFAVAIQISWTYFIYKNFIFTTKNAEN